jgi:23S rRNA (guanosine2251-2'-O)-methyltransferase
MTGKPHKPYRPGGPRRGDRRPGSGAPPRTDREDGLQRLYGVHSVGEALRNPRRRLSRLIATENGALRLAEEGPLPIAPTIVKAEDITRQLPADAVHQGVLLIAEPLPPLPIAALPDQALVLALDQVTDPHNVGAILRSAAAFGVDALLATERHAPALTGVLSKAASGALEHVPMVQAKNLSQALDALRDRGFLLLGLDSEGETDFAELSLTRPLCLVLGAEGKGLRHKTRGMMDRLARLDMPGAIKSLNVSNAAAIALYAVNAALKR